MMKLSPYVSSPKKMIRHSTTAPYMDPMPYVHRQLQMDELGRQSTAQSAHFVRATMNPNANGEMNGDRINPMVQMLSCTFKCYGL